MEKIDSFKIDHDCHPVGLYLSKQMGDIYTYDLRMKTPNGGDYLAVPALHSIEHLVATAIRNGREKDKVVYFGPMGCRTGCYLLLKGIPYAEAKKLLIETLKVCLEFAEVPGAKRAECGNYLEHDLEGAKREICSYLRVLEG
jgi:S-ribosylhomocysteine lyase